MKTQGAPVGDQSTQYVSSWQELNNAINLANELTSSDPAFTIIFETDIELGGNTTPINTAGSVVIEADAASANLDGQGAYSGFVIISGSVSLSGINIKNMLSQSQAGCMGAGGGLFIANIPPANGSTGSSVSVTLTNVTFYNCSVQGGAYNLVAGGSGGSGGGNGAEPGISGSGGFNPTSSILGQVEGGCFGLVGVGGAGGPGGAEGSPGQQGGQGGDGGYGGGGGCAGSGGGGGGGIPWNSIYYFNAQSGGGAGPPSVPGFGGGCAFSRLVGDPPNNYTGGDGGFAVTGSGAAFGGAIFVMDNATLQFQGVGSISGGKVVAGAAYNPDWDFMDAAAAGAGIFLQGAGVLTFQPSLGDTYTISDPIADESGAVLSGAAIPSDRGNGPDNLPAGGGTGAWGISVTGEGTVILAGPHAFSGIITIQSGAIDLSGYSNPASNDVSLQSDGQLVFQPSSGSQLQFNAVTVSSQASFVLNGYSSISVNTLDTSENVVVLVLDSTGFTVGTSVQVITTTQPLSQPLTVSVSNSSTGGTYSAQVNENGIEVTLTAT